MVSDKIEPLNMHGHANTWEEELLETAKERDGLCAEVEGLESEVVAEHELNRKAMAEIEGLRAALTAALEQNERFAAELTKLRALIDTHNDERRECPVLE